MLHQLPVKAVVVHAQHQGQPLCGHIAVFVVEGRDHFGQHQDAAHGRNRIATDAARVAAAIHALMVLQHSLFNLV